MPLHDSDGPIFSPIPNIPEQSIVPTSDMWRHLYGRYGESANEIVQSASPQDLTTIPDTSTLWAELAFSAEYEQVRHLADLLLRRVRIGLLTPYGGKTYMRRIKKQCGPVLGWNRNKWRQEINMYYAQWTYAHSLPRKLREDLLEREPP